MVVLFVILGILGYLIVGLLLTLLIPIYPNLWSIVTLNFAGWEYDFSSVTELFDFDDEDSLLFVCLFSIFWPLAIVISLIILPFVFIYCFIRFVILLPSNLHEKREKEKIARENYEREIEFKYKHIMALE